jgi:hypothetical protein
MSNAKQHSAILSFEMIDELKNDRWAKVVRKEALQLKYLSTVQQLYLTHLFIPTIITVCEKCSLIIH